MGQEDSAGVSEPSLKQTESEVIKPSDRMRKLFLEIYSEIPQVEETATSPYGNIYKIDPLEGGIFFRRVRDLLPAIIDAYQTDKDFGYKALRRDELTKTFGDVDQARKALYDFLSDVTHQPLFSYQETEEEGYSSVAAIYQRYNETGDFERFKQEALPIYTMNGISIGNGTANELRTFLGGYYWGNTEREPDTVYSSKGLDDQAERYIQITTEHEDGHYQYMQEAVETIHRPELAPFVTFALMTGENDINFAPTCSDKRIFDELLAGNISQDDFNTYRRIANQKPLHHEGSIGDEIMLDVKAGVSSEPKN